MSFLGFNNIKMLSVPVISVGGFKISGLKVFIGHKKLEKSIYKTTSVIMISIRGTDPTQLSNLLADVNAYPYRWDTGLPFPTNNPLHKGPGAHGGFYFGVNEIWKILQADSDYSQYIDKGNALFIVTGHSLGGALAELLSLKLRENHTSANSIISYGFASPPVGNKELWKFADEYDITCRIHKIMNEADKIPTLGFFAYTLANNVVKFKDSRGNLLDNHSMELVYLNYYLNLLGVYSRATVA